MKTINILGTEYILEQDESIIDKDCDGLCAEYSKKISIRPVHEMLCKDCTDQEREKRYNEVLRHEIIHAAFSESGLDDYSNNEQLVNWIAIQFPKLFKLFNELECLK